jgi:small subunit ribosomal protein S17
MEEKKKTSGSEKGKVVVAPLKKVPKDEELSKKVGKSVPMKKVVGTLSLRGRKFQGVVIRKFGNRVTIEFERTRLIRKYERYIKTKTKMHARLLEGMDVEIGDYIQVQECRPLSKILHHVVVKKIRGRDEK